MNDKTKAAATAGGLLGIVLVLVAAAGALVARGAGCCNCLLPIGGGILAVYLYTKKSPTPVQPGDGALLGAIAGAVGGLIYLFVGVPLVYFVSAAALTAQLDQLRQSGINLPAGLSVLALTVIGGIVGVVVYTIMATIGGLIGAAIFKGPALSGPAAPPPPPANFGGPSPTGFGAPPPVQPPPPPPPAGDACGNFGAGS